MHFVPSLDPGLPPLVFCPVLPVYWLSFTLSTLDASPRHHNSERPQSSQLSCILHHDLQLENLPVWTHSSIFPPWEWNENNDVKMTTMNAILTMTVMTGAATTWWVPVAATFWNGSAICILSTGSLNKANSEGTHIDVHNTCTVQASSYPWKSWDPEKPPVPGHTASNGRAGNWTKLFLTSYMCSFYCISLLWPWEKYRKRRWHAFVANNSQFWI